MYDPSLISTIAIEASLDKNNLIFPNIRLNTCKHLLATFNLNN